jgi:ribosome recycling factor
MLTCLYWQAVKAVEKAIRDNLDLNLNPTRVDEMTLRVPVPRSVRHYRTALLCDAYA